MKPEGFLKSKALLIVAAIFILVIATIVVVALGLGQAYKGGLSEVNSEAPPEYTLRKKKDIKRITIRKGDENSCIEVTPDGVVRVYETCGGELSDASRLTDPKNILKLFKIASETDLAKYANQGTGTLYQLTIETDQGTEIITLVLNDDTPEFIEDVIDTIENIEEDIPPNPSPSANPSGQLNPTPPPGSSPRPSPTLPPGSSPGPSPSNDPQEPFSCDFSDTGGTKPTRISNTVCTSEPV